MAPRANWKGYLRLSLVSCPIALYPASSLSEKVSFNRLNRKTAAGTLTMSAPCRLVFQLRTYRCNAVNGSFGPQGDIRSCRPGSS